MLPVAIALVSCSAENITESTIPAENLLTLQRVETYQPSKEVYDNGGNPNQFTNKTIQYFEDGLIVADSTFNNVHHLESVTVRTATATSASQITYNRDNIAIYTALFTYDGTGRIIELSVSSLSINYRETIAYTATGSATVTYHNTANGSSEVMGTFVPNEDGLLTSFNAENENQHLVFEGGKPVTFNQRTMGSSTVINMEYYDVPVPANRLKTVTQVNNVTLTGALVQSVAENSGYYFKSLEGIYNHSHTFNNLNYIEHSIKYDLINHGTTETFYYYNE